MGRDLCAMLLFLALVASCNGLPAPAEDAPGIVDKHIHPVFQPGGPVAGNPVAGAIIGGSPAPNGIAYHGGPVILGTTQIYYIWYGDAWQQDPQGQAYLTTLAQKLGGSAWYNICTTYYSGSSSSRISNSVALNRSVSVSETTSGYGKSLTDSTIWSIVSYTINKGLLPADANGVYFVLTAPGITEASSSTSSFCTNYCGWHAHASIRSPTTRKTVDIKYAFVGNAAGCPSPASCIAMGLINSTISGSWGADGMASVIAHELAEAVTDPDLNAWYFDSNRNECADQCFAQFGTLYQRSDNVSYANVNLGGTDYLLQENWVNANGGYCSLQFP